MDTILQWFDAPWKYILVTFWLTMSLVTFCVSMFFCVLGGDSSDLWKPFGLALLGPIGLIWTFRL